MASEQKFVDFIINQIGFSEHVTNKKMFGEYGLYFDNKLLVYFIIISQLFFLISVVGFVDYWADFRKRIKNLKINQHLFTLIE